MQLKIILGFEGAALRCICIQILWLNFRSTPNYYDRRERRRSIKAVVGFFWQLELVEFVSFDNNLDYEFLEQIQHSEFSFKLLIMPMFRRKACGLFYELSSSSDIFWWFSQCLFCHQFIFIRLVIFKIFWFRFFGDSLGEQTHFPLFEYMFECVFVPVWVPMHVCLCICLLPMTTCVLPLYVCLFKLNIRAYVRLLLVSWMYVWMYVCQYMCVLLLI